MKLDFKTSPLITSGDMEASKMSITEESKDIFSYYFRDKIYTNKVLACVREYICNATDEHIKHNVDRPVEVSLKKEANTYIWRCRDFAKGLSNVGIRTIFGMYGASTKREDNAQTGVFGVGSKSFFSFTDTFYVTSHHEGTQTDYVCILGGGDKGVPVGEIYKVSEKPTTESGIEISADVTKDRHGFDTETKKFVTNFHPSVKLTYTNHDGEVYNPAIPVETYADNGYVFSKYSDDFVLDGIYDNHNYAIRMGGVVYRMNHEFRGAEPTTKIVVDVPIGKLSVPISREDIEMTPSNNRILADIEKSIAKLVEWDKTKLVEPSLGVVLSNNGYKVSEKALWFDYDFKTLYPDLHRVFRHIDKAVGFSPVETNANQNHMIYVVPNIINPKNWIKRLNMFMTYVGKTNFYYTVKTPLIETVLNDSLVINKSDCVFVDVKTLGLPKLVKGDQDPNTKYQVFQRRSKYKYTPEELEKEICHKYFNDVEIEDDWYLNVTDTDELNHRTIGMVSEYGTRSSFYTTTSKKMMEKMIEIGWIDRNGEEYASKAQEITERLQKERNMEQSEDKIKSLMWHVNILPQVITAIGKDPSKIDRIKKVLKKIENENSSRARILHSLDNYEYRSNVTRKDIRNILKMNQTI